jgi:hypothetical protein
MRVKKIHRYVMVSNPTKSITILEDIDGWFYIAKLPIDQNNTWSSIEEIEQYLGVKIKPYDIKEVW